MKQILLVASHPAAIQPWRTALNRSHLLSHSTSTQEAERLLSEERPDLVLMDISAADLQVAGFYERTRRRYPDLPMGAAMNGVPLPEHVSTLPWDFIISINREPTYLRKTLDRVIAANRALRLRIVAERELAAQVDARSLIGETAAFKNALTAAQQAAEADEPVLLIGEAGTGKELLSRHIHMLGIDQDEPFISLTEFLRTTSLEQTLFGTALQTDQSPDPRSYGLLDLAGAGTLYLPQVHQLPELVQQKLTALLETGFFQRSNSSEPVPNAARLMVSIVGNSASIPDSPLLAAFERRIELPALRERVEDIPLLAYHFLSRLKLSLQATCETFETETLDLLCRYSWPGNVRELRNVIDRILMIHPEARRIRPEHLPKEISGASARAVPEPGSIPYEEAVNAFERELIIKALSRTNGVIGKAADLLGTTRRILIYRVEKLGIRKVAE